jgi:23S rRNA pseudouridine1911/1915/1917 synthase
MTTQPDCPTGAAPLLDWVLLRHPDTPRTRAKQWILAGRVSVGGAVIRRPHERIPDPGDALQLLGRQAATLACDTGWQIHPRVALVYLDATLAVVNKGPGIISVPAPNSGPTALGILADFLAGRLRARVRGVAGRTLPPAYQKLQPLPVHRLDQYTSGLFCMALNPPARRHLIAQLQAHTMTREYVAFVEGRSSVASGTWRQWLQLSEDELRQRIVAPVPGKTSRLEPQEAVTHFEVIAEFPLANGRDFVSKLRLRLETGRKHQIRVQAAAAGLPLVGDRTYHPGYRERASGRALVEFPRQALHAQVLSLEHPDQPGKRLSWTAELPPDLRQLEATLSSFAIASKKP